MTDYTTPIDDTHRDCADARDDLNRFVDDYIAAVRLWDIAPTPDRKTFP